MRQFPCYGEAIRKYYLFDEKEIDTFTCNTINTIHANEGIFYQMVVCVLSWSYTFTTQEEEEDTVTIFTVI